jgi:hypothetical protein
MASTRSRGVIVIHATVESAGQHAITAPSSYASYVPMNRASPHQQGEPRVIARKLTIAAIGSFLAVGLAPAAAHAGKPAGPSTSVCNEAENSPQGGYTVNGGPVDPNPPAFLRGSQMRVGNGHGKGLVNAAEHSPALRTCGPTGTGTGGGGDDGSGDGEITAT